MKKIYDIGRWALKTAQKRSYSRKQERFDFDATFTGAASRFPERTALYRYMHHYMHHRCPLEVQQHRSYFTKERRGFGEDAFHAMWCLLFKEFRPKDCLEIGVYRGQVISLWAMIAKIEKMECRISAISPFTPAGDLVSTYTSDIDYLNDTISHHAYFQLPQPQLVRALSTDAAALAHISSRSWNLIYIDGNHDYEVALADYEACVGSLADNGLLVMDDSSLYTNYSAPRFAFAGHPGPSKVVQDRAMKEMQFIAGVGHNNVFVKR